jgi:SAM-dependent methyltransferase
MARQRDLDAYESRYRTVFEAGALHWNDPTQNQPLSDILVKLPPGSRCVEFGCGEGYQCQHMARMGHKVLGIDLSPTVIEKARLIAPDGLDLEFIIADITDANRVGLAMEHFDLAVDINCLHMMAFEEDRAAYMAVVWNALKIGGLFFIEDGLSLDDVQPKSEAERVQLEEMRLVRSRPPGSLLGRTIVTSRGEEAIDLPLCPLGRSQSLQGYISELVRNSFKVVSAERRGGLSQSYEAIVVAQKEHV